MMPIMRDKTIFNKRIDPLNIIPYVYVLGFCVLGGFNVFFILSAIRSFSVPESLQGLVQALLFYSIPFFVIWIMSRAVRFIKSFRREIRKILIGSQGVKIYKPYTKHIEIPISEVSEKIVSFNYAKNEGKQLGYQSNEYVISLLLSNGQSLAMTCSSENFNYLRKFIDSHNIDVNEVDVSELQLFV